MVDVGVPGAAVAAGAAPEDETADEVVANEVVATRDALDEAWADGEEVANVVVSADVRATVLDAEVEVVPLFRIANMLLWDTGAYEERGAVAN